MESRIFMRKPWAFRLVKVMESYPLKYTMRVHDADPIRAFKIFLAFFSKVYYTKWAHAGVMEW